MNAPKIIAQLKSRYPRKTIVKNNEESPTEIICEIVPTVKDSKRSVAIAIIDRSEPHFHKNATERYEVTKGQLILSIDAVEYILHEGDKKTIRPGSVHFATGKETWVKTTSTPGWTPDDHIKTKI